MQLLGEIAVIVTRNRLDKLKTAYENIACQSVEGIVVVNNLSTDGTTQWLDSLADSRLLIHHSKRNIGGAGGFNKGFKLAMEHFDPGWILCFDDDAYPFPHALSMFRSMEFAPDVGAVAGAVFFPDGAVADMNRPFINPFSNPSRFLPSLLKGKKTYHIPDSCYGESHCIEVSVSSFVGCFIRGDLVRGDLGLPPRDLFLYGDDLIYTLGIGRLGYKILFVPGIKFFHDCGSGMNQDNVIPLWKLFFLIRNNIEFLRELSGRFFLPAVFLKMMAFCWKIRLYENKLAFSKILCVAAMDGFRRNFSKDYDAVRSMVNGCNG